MYGRQHSGTWDNAAFSDLTDAALRRFFSFEIQVYFERIAELPIDNEGMTTQAVRPIEHLRKQHARFFDPALNVPLVYLQYFRVMEKEKMTIALNQLSASTENNRVLATYIKAVDQLTEKPPFSFHQLDYFRLITDGILRSEKDVDKLTQQMVGLNFNHLGYYAELQASVRNRLEELHCASERKSFLQGRLLWLKGTAENIKWCYDPTFPSLKTLLVEWLSELLLAENSPAAAPAGEKLKITLPASELACFLFASNAQGWYADHHLQSVFHFICVHFSSKNKERLSPKNLSKEYYSITQQTAARTRDRLQQMIAAINKRFFPV